MRNRPDSARKLSANLYDIYHCCVYSKKTPDDGQRNCPKHVEFYSENKFEKLVHLVGFIVRVLLVFAGLDDATITGTDKVQDGGPWKRWGGVT